MKRRDFFAASVAAVAAASASSIVKADCTTDEWDGKSPNQSSKAKLRISSQIHIIPGEKDEDKFERMKKWGIEGVELAGWHTNDPDYWKRVITDNGLTPSAVCWGSHNGDLCSDVVEKRQQGVDDLKKALEGAGIIVCTGVIYVPAFNGQTKLTNQEIRKVLMDTFPALAEFAAECGTNIILEPLNRGEAYFLRQVADGAAIARDVNNGKGIGVMGDFYHMSIEETDMMGAFISAGSYLKHVHLAGGVTDPRRTIPGQNKTRFVEGFRGLKYIGYDKFCSFECGVRGDKEVEIPKACEFLRREWELAVI